MRKLKGILFILASLSLSSCKMLLEEGSIAENQTEAEYTTQVQTNSTISEEAEILAADETDYEAIANEVSSVVAAAPAPAGVAQATLFGDSYAAGANPDGGPGYANILQKRYPNPTHREFGRGGSTAKQWAANFKDNLANVVRTKPDVFIFQLGGNDFQGALEDGVYSNSERQELRANLRKIYRALKAGAPNAKILQIGYPDLFDKRSEYIPNGLTMFNGRPSGLYKKQSQYILDLNDDIKDVAAEFGAYYVSIYEDFIDHAYARYLPKVSSNPKDLYFKNLLIGGVIRYDLADIHPNTKGHTKIADLVEARLKKENIIK